MDLYTEIRKLSPGDLYNLVQILEYDESWKKLMAVIPKNVTLDNFECKITINNLPKYNTDHFKLIDTAGYKQRRPCAEILIEEWSTSGRIRPRLGHLITLLKKTELYRAADYIAMELLKMPELDRPTSGPAAKVNIPQDELLNEHIPHNVSLDYPSSLLEGNPLSSSVLNDYINNQPKHVIPTIIVNEPDVSRLMSDFKIENVVNDIQVLNQLEQQDVRNQIHNDVRNNIQQNEVLNNIQQEILNQEGNNNQVSNEDNNLNNIPAFSALLELDNVPSVPIIETFNKDVKQNTENFTPDFSNILKSLNLGEQSEVPYTTDNGIQPNSNVPDILNSNNNPIQTSNFTPHFSNIMFSNGQNSDGYIPDLSNIMHSNNNVQNGVESSYMPALTDIMSSQNNVDNKTNQNGAEYMPALSMIMNSNNAINPEQNLIPAFSSILNSNQNNIPDISNMLAPVDNIPAFSQILNTSHSSAELSSTEMPHFSELLSTSNKPDSPQANLDLPQISRLLATSPAPSVQSSSSRTCASPLPNLYLNTALPHFTYLELEQCTENFDETILSMQDSANLNQAARFGRKLGSGAFGSVYLGIGLLDKPVAVKKLNLNGVIVVNIDDTITKQFKNEVELLCMYKHENLLSLLGYSCDGPTYCLIYEYICGGALKDRLQSSLKSPEQFRLLWTDRLYIALGTAKAVSYLHNAHSMPLIHRDIKSANILLDAVNKPKLCDFGLIKLTPNPNTNTGTTVFGTSAYMAPEAFRGDVSVKLDTFSFGVVLLELLTSLPPLDENREGNDLVTHVEEVCEDDIKPLLDMSAGSWVVDQTHFGEAMYEIATQCLEEKKRRLVMSKVVAQLSELIKSVPL